MQDIYKNGQYLDVTETWHAEDAPWKAGQIRALMQRNSLVPATLAEIGCGSGAVLNELSRFDELQAVRFSGFDISPQAIEITSQWQNDRIEFSQQDLLAGEDEHRFDVLMAIDVFEHVPDYLGFVQKCQAMATYKIYHIPLDIHVSAVLRNSFIRNRYTIGHIHYFTAESALATLRDSGHEIIDAVYTNGSFGLFKEHPSAKKAIANLPRWLMSRFSTALAARWFGGYSLLVLAK